MQKLNIENNAENTDEYTKLAELNSKIKPWCKYSRRSYSIIKYMQKFDVSRQHNLQIYPTGIIWSLLTNLKSWDHLNSIYGL